MCSVLRWNGSSGLVTVPHERSLSSGERFHGMLLRIELLRTANAKKKCIGSCKGVSPVKDEGVECDPEIYRNHLHALKRATTFENTEQGPLP